MSTAIDTTGYIDISGDGGLLKKILQEGFGDAFPETGMEVTAHYTGTLDSGKKFDSSRDRNKEFKFVIGKGQVIKGWDKGFATMKKGEKAILRCRQDYAYGSGGQGDIPPNATLNFDVELIDFKPKKKETWEMTMQEKVSSANRLKDEGTELFKEKRFAEALKLYEESAELVANVIDAEATWIACKLNSAQCAIYLTEYPAAVAYCGAVLKKDADNIKALYRRGLARNHLGLPEEALVDLNRALELDKENKPVAAEIVKAKKLIADAKKKEKSAYGNMFSKMSVYEDKVVTLDVATNPKVFFDITIGGRAIGRVVMQLFENIVPKTVQNFLSLCRGDCGIASTGQPLFFKGSSFHRVIEGYFVAYLCNVCIY